MKRAPYHTSDQRTFRMLQEIQQDIFENGTTTHPLHYYTAKYNVSSICKRTHEVLREIVYSDTPVSMADARKVRAIETESHRKYVQARLAKPSPREVKALHLMEAPEVPQEFAYFYEHLYRAAHAFNKHSGKKVKLLIT